MNVEVDFSNQIIAMNQSSIVVKLIQLQTQFKIFHWQTFSFSHHNAFGSLYDSLSESIDEFVETYQGIYGRFDFGGASFSIVNLSDSDFISILNDNIQSLTQYESLFNNTDLLNIRDEILASINRTKYLLTLN